MAYATTLQFAQRSGIGIRIVDENVGTGDNAEKDFDLDNDNVIASSYTLSYATAADPNNQTALTETTHYTLDKESGRIRLTDDGVTAVGTSVIYATYWYTDSFSDSVISNLIDVADDEIDIWTGRKWDSPVSATEYHSGRAASRYPTTDRPYQQDYDESEFIALKQSPVTAVDNVYFLASPLSVSKAFNYDDNLTTYTDITDNVNSITETIVDVWAATPAANDIIYIGASHRFLGLTTSLGTVGVDNGTTAVDWEYWNGSAWTDLTETDTDTGASIFTVSGTFTWSFPAGWAKTTVNSSESLFWVRGVITTADYATEPTLNTLKVLDAINVPLEPRQYQVEGNNKLHFTGTSVVNGTRNIRVDYKYGSSSTPSYITELSVLIASLQAFVGLSGGSFDDATSYSLGSKSVTIGEVYVNIREVIAQIKARIDEIYRMIGRRADVLAI